ncbi:hypothetical protein E2C01_021620 [Portunus trituberculatus]|uniref:Uncharacterized protein n=1 Tax=Portunus trituberculatus TaxID=210409 RepID=A0A5B7E5F2_PORTR|nr:hypothetical protein [Portunus trituberculatus]
MRSADVYGDEWSILSVLLGVVQQPLKVSQDSGKLLLSLVLHPLYTATTTTTTTITTLLTVSGVATSGSSVELPIRCQGICILTLFQVSLLITSTGVVFTLARTWMDN